MERKMITRRKFIKAGALFLPLAGMVKPTSAFARILTMMHGASRSSAAAGTSWVTWNESAESGWGDTGTNICILENINAGGSETSQGVVSGANLTYTEGGNLAGAVLAGGYYTRTFDGINDYISITQTLADIIKQRNTWTVIVKFSAMSGITNGRLISFLGNAPTNQIRIICNDASRHITVKVLANGGAILDTQITDGVPAASDFYVWVGGDGTNTYGGWSLTRPSSHTSVPASQRVQAVAFTQFAAHGFDFGSKFMIAYDGSTGPLASTVYYFIISQSALIPY